MKKIIVTDSKEYIKYPDLIDKLESRNCVFVDRYIKNLSEVKELFDDDEKILMLDELNIKDDFRQVNKYLDKMNNVKFICSFSSRYHEFDLQKATKLEIKYCNNPNTTSRSVAEMALMHLMSLIRKQPMYKNKDFDFFGMNNLGRELDSLSVGILGYGNIGKKIASICSSLGMNVKVWSRSKKKGPFPQVEIKELFGQDVIFISIVSGEEAKALFGKVFYKALNENKYIIDIVGDDNLYDKNELIKMCNKKQLAGFGFEAESPKSKYITSSANVSISPHVGWELKKVIGG